MSEKFQISKLFLYVFFPIRKCTKCEIEFSMKDNVNLNVSINQIISILWQFLFVEQNSGNWKEKVFGDLSKDIGHWLNNQDFLETSYVPPWKTIFQSKEFRFYL